MLDGLFLNFLLREIKSDILNLYVDKVYHTSKEELVIYFRSSKRYKLLLNINPSYVRLNLTDQNIENPSTPTMFCMLMRKYLNNAKLIDISQCGLERVVFFKFETSNEVCDKITVKLIMEIMGRHSNIILVDENNIILDAIKRVSCDMSRVRQIYPKIMYTLPPNFNKLNILTSDINNFFDTLCYENFDELQKQLILKLEGFSPIIAKEIIYRANQGMKKSGDKFNDCLNQELYNLKSKIQNQYGHPYVFRSDDNMFRDFSFMKQRHLIESGFNAETYDTFNQLLDIFYREKNNADRVIQNSKNLIHMLTSIYKKLKNKLEIQKKEKKQCVDKERYQQLAILLQSNLYKIQKNDKFIVVENFFDDNKPTRIDLDPRLSGAGNAQLYFNKYKKMCFADKKLDDLIVDTKNEISYIESVLDNISRSTTRENLDQIKLELQQQGYLCKKKEIKQVDNKSKKDKFIKVISVDGFEILIGNNNVDNDRLTFKHANKNDIWLHAQKIPGAHVIIVTGGREVSTATLEQAAKLAARNSKAQNNSLVNVDYTYVKNVKKFKGARPGMVIYDNFKTIIVK